MACRSDPSGTVLRCLPRAFGTLFRDWARKIRADRPEELVLQPTDRRLDQVTLPVTIHSFGGGRPGPDPSGLDGEPLPRSEKKLRNLLKKEGFWMC
ncbi:hypothetical protein [Histidinibacterium lentulum]|uniref:hypothetical protein n=1 Tax=Histidinibacterium lentulum TaxID=2480588 RepID=UPI001617E802|nr:hypothetical protein [Histidinibacterium lentulum]